MTHEELPLERLKTEAERWVPCLANEGTTQGAAAAGLRDIVQRAYDLGRTLPEVEEKLTMQSALRSALGLWSGHCRECGGYNCHSVEPVRCSTMDKIAELERLAGIERVEHEQLPQREVKP